VIAPEAIRDGARALGVDVDTASVQKLSALADLLVQWNQAYNLISTADVARILPRHLLDSLALLPHLRGRRILDAGTGAGLPGLPLAIVSPERSFVLLDRSEKKLKFVRQAKIELAIDNVEIVCTDLKLYRPAACFDTVVARALAAPDAIWRSVERLVSACGRVVLACGDPNAIALPGAAIIEPHRIVIPGLDEPHWVVVLKRRLGTESALA